MLSRSVRLKLIAFVLIGVTVVGYTAFRYANLGRLIGLRGYYLVKVELADAGGIFPDADVTYRGVSVGRVNAVRLTQTGVEADLRITDSAPPIPADLTAVVADLSPVGEQYVDLLPRTTSGPYLTDGSVISEADTQLPPLVTTLLTSLDSLAHSLPLSSLRTVLHEFSLGVGGQAGNIQVLLDDSHAFLRTAANNASQVAGLVRDSKTVLATQINEAAALNNFASSARLFAHQLVRSDADLRRLIAAAPQAATQLDDLLVDTNPALAELIANLLTTSELGSSRISALDELLSGVPVALVDFSSAITAKGLNVGLTLSFFNPLPCTLGYSGTIHRNGLDTSPAPTLNVHARCLRPASSGIDVRGSAHAPSGGGVPPPAQPGLAQLLGLNG
ncbi:MAG TPA: MlaD family protein [Streptosporangiaceae bacterium]|nr:MlaD family protein [Streptosporangiaceae bacterium]